MVGCEKKRVIENNTMRAIASVRKTALVEMRKGKVEGDIDEWEINIKSMRAVVTGKRAISDNRSECEILV